MTLRVTIEIVPYGDESAKYEINRFDISNIGLVETGAFGHDKYKYSVTPYESFIFRNKKETYVLEDFLFEIPSHNRRDGEIELVRKVMNKFKELSE